MDALRYFKLKNQGSFVARIHVNYRQGGEDAWRTWTPAHYADINYAAERTLDLTEIGIEDGTHVRLVAYVVAGDSQTAGEEFIFFSNIGKTAVYEITGTTLINKLRLKRVADKTD